jgi:hypothetical protein
MTDTTLRDRIRRVLCEHDGKDYLWGTDMLEPDEYGETADAVLAVLPPPVDRAAVLREGAEAIDATFTGPDTDRYVRYGANLLRRMADEAVDTVTAEHHTVDGVGYLCHTDDHYCPPTDEAQPAQPQTGEAPFIPPAHYRGRDGTAYCVHAIPVGPSSCAECHDLDAQS